MTSRRVDVGGVQRAHPRAVGAPELVQHEAQLLSPVSITHGEPSRVLSLPRITNRSGLHSRAGHTRVQSVVFEGVLGESLSTSGRWRASMTMGCTARDIGSSLSAHETTGGGEQPYQFGEHLPDRGHFSAAQLI